MQKFPDTLLTTTYFDSNKKIQARTEVERREKYFESMESLIGLLYPKLVQLVKQCLHNDPSERPISEDLLLRLQEIKAEIKSEIHINISETMRLIDTLKEKESRIEELVQQKVKL